MKTALQAAEIPSEIIPGELYLGAQGHAQSIETLDRLGIRFVLNCAIECTNSYPNHITSLELKLQDYKTESLLTSFPTAFQFIDLGIQSDSAVLVHCMVTLLSH